MIAKLVPNAVLSRLFASAVDALASPVKSNLELLQFTWESLLRAYESANKIGFETSKIEETSIPGNLSTILSLIQKDERKRFGLDSELSCLDYFIQERALTVLVDYVKTDKPKGLRLEVTQFFSVLISRHPSRILPHLTARRPLLKLIHCFLSDPEESAIVKEAHINLLLSIITTLNQNSGLLGLFTTIPTMRPRRASSISGPITLNVTNTVVKTEACAPVQILLVSLQNYICNGGSIGIHARGALFELIHLLSSEPESTDLLIQDPTFKNIMLGQLKVLFTSMPTETLLGEGIDEKAKVTSSGSSAFTLPASQAQIDGFFELWKFTNKLLSTTISLYPVISGCILNSIIVPFLDEVVYEEIMDSSLAVSCSRVMYYLEMLQESPSQEAYSALLSVISSPKEGKPCLLDLLIQRICDDDEDASIVSLQLFDTLLATYHPKVYQSILPGLFSSCSKNPPANEALVKRLLGLLKPIKSDLRQDLKEFLDFLNPPSNGHDEYFIESLISSDRDYSKILTLHTQVSQSTPENQLPPLLGTLVNELCDISGRSHKRIILITGILLRLMKLPSSRLLAEESLGSPYLDFANILCEFLSKGLVDLETKMEAIGQDVWDFQAIEDSTMETPPLSPSCSSHIDSQECPPNTPSAVPMRERSYTAPSQLVTHETSPQLGLLTPRKLSTSSATLDDFSVHSLQLTPPSAPAPPTSNPTSPCLDFLNYVAEPHRPLFLSYVALQESCKELAAFLTVFYSLDSPGASEPTPSKI